MVSPVVTKMEVDNVQVQSLKNEYFAHEDSKDTKKADMEITLKVSMI